MHLDPTATLLAAVTAYAHGNDAEALSMFDGMSHSERDAVCRAGVEIAHRAGTADGLIGIHEWLPTAMPLAQSHIQASMLLVAVVAVDDGSTAALDAQLGAALSSPDDALCALVGIVYLAMRWHARVEGSSVLDLLQRRCLERYVQVTADHPTPG